jgi:hypothetical protein
MGALTVYATATARRYHSTDSCPALLSAQNLSDWDCNEYCRHDHPRMHPALGCTVAEATERGQTPCRACTPPLAESNTFGHEPLPWPGMSNASGMACARCWPGEPIPWPCATAVLLSLADPT